MLLHLNLTLEDYVQSGLSLCKSKQCPQTEFGGVNVDLKMYITC